MITYLKRLEVTLLGYSLHFLVSFFLRFALSSVFLIRSFLGSWISCFVRLLRSLGSFAWFIRLVRPCFLPKVCTQRRAGAEEDVENSRALLYATVSGASAPSWKHFLREGRHVLLAGNVRALRTRGCLVRSVVKILSPGRTCARLYR